MEVYILEGYNKYDELVCLELFKTREKAETAQNTYSKEDPQVEYSVSIKEVQE